MLCSMMRAQGRKARHKTIQEPRKAPESKGRLSISRNVLHWSMKVEENQKLTMSAVSI